jgi:hypothetical protein
MPPGLLCGFIPFACRHAVRDADEKTTRESSSFASEGHIPARDREEAAHSDAFDC